MRLTRWTLESGENDIDIAADFKIHCMFRTFCITQSLPPSPQLLGSLGVNQAKTQSSQGLAEGSSRQAMPAQAGKYEWSYNGEDDSEEIKADIPKIRDPDSERFRQIWIPGRSSSRWRKASNRRTAMLGAHASSCILMDDGFESEVKITKKALKVGSDALRGCTEKCGKSRRLA